MRNDPFNNDQFDKQFDKHFERAEARLDKHFDRADNLLDHPVRTFIGVALVTIILNVLFWGTLIVGTVWAVSHFLL